MLFKLYFLTKLCLHTIYKYLINVLLTNLQEQYFTTCFHACSTVSCRHNLLTNCEILVCRLQSFLIFLNKIKITFTASNCYSNKSVFEFCSTYFQVILISFMHVIKPHVNVELHLINVESPKLSSATQIYNFT